MARKCALIALIVLGISIIACYHLPTGKALDIIWKEGHITADETWFYIPNTVYRVIADVYVDSNVTLAIEPNVRIEFADGFSLIINGNLNATGTQDDPIIFTSSRGTPSPGVWNAIVFQANSMGHLVLEHARIEYAVDGIRIQSLASAVVQGCDVANCSNSGIMVTGQSNVMIKDNILRNNKHGISTDSSGHSHITITGNTVSSNTGHGIYLYSDGDLGYNDISDISLLSNTASYNGGSGVYISATANGNAIIHSVSILSNTFVSNGGDGIYLQSAGSSGDIHNVSVLSNSALSNGENGIYLSSWGFGPSGDDLYNVSLSSNTASSNKANGLCLVGGHNTGLTYDVAVSANSFSGNDDCGIWVRDRVVINLTQNSLSYNRWGVVYTTSRNNRAGYNDVYANDYYGMTVVDGATVNAENNYWGDSTGPYQPSVNPEGKGNSVNGNGVDLDFIPFFTSPQGHINQRPVAVLSVDNNNVGVGETVSFNGTASTDDGRIDYYFFDFGDGTNSSWTTLPVVTHKYSQEKTYNATLFVMDDFRVTSNNTQQTVVQVIVIPEFPSFLILPLFMLATLAVVVVRERKRLKFS
jgi:parallel beta-helix repeat protein